MAFLALLPVGEECSFKSGGGKLVYEGMFFAGLKADATELIQERATMVVWYPCDLDCVV